MGQHEGPDRFERNIVEAVLQNLSGRKGFDWWWLDIEPDVRAEIRASLVESVRGVVVGDE